jgi:putative ABC transport system ATP-binding protein
VELAARVSFLLENIGLADRGNSYPDRLSGGEQQRVAIARAIAHEPPLILADEPTGNLDAATANTTLGLLERLQKREGVTLVVATHSTEVARRADRVLQLRELQF